MGILVCSRGCGNNTQKAGRQCNIHQEVKFWPDSGNHRSNVQGNNVVIPEHWIIPQRLPQLNPLDRLWFTLLYNSPRMDFISVSDSHPVSLLLWNIIHRTCIDLSLNYKRIWKHTRNQTVAILALRSSRPRLESVYCAFSDAEKHRRSWENTTKLSMATARVLQKRNGYIRKSFSPFDVEYAIFFLVLKWELTLNK